MKKLLIILLTLMYFTACSNDDTDIYSMPIWLPTDNGYNLVWEDNFEGNKIDKTKWNYRAVGSTRANAIVDSSTVYLDGNGHLVIELSEKNGFFYIGQLSTQNIHTFKYGYFECSALLNQKPGMHSAFWLQSPKVNEGGNTIIHGAEIDIFEYLAIDPNGVYNSIFWDYTNLKSIKKRTHAPSISVGYHTFGLEWTPDEYIFYIDNRKVWKTSTAVSQIEQYIILSTEYSGWGGQANPQELPDKIIFDYVKVYSKE